MSYRIAGIDVHKKMLAVVDGIDGAVWETGVAMPWSRIGKRICRKPISGRCSDWRRCLVWKRIRGKRLSPKGNRTLRRLLNQAANAAVRLKGSIFGTDLSEYGAAHGRQQGDLGDRASPLQSDLEDFARGGVL